MEGTEPIRTTFNVSIHSKTSSYHFLSKTTHLTVTSRHLRLELQKKKRPSNDEVAIENSHMTSPDHGALVVIN